MNANGTRSAIEYEGTRANGQRICEGMKTKDAKVSRSTTGPWYVSSHLHPAPCTTPRASHLQARRWTLAIKAQPMLALAEALIARNTNTSLRRLGSAYFHYQLAVVGLKSWRLHYAHRLSLALHLRDPRDELRKPERVGGDKGRGRAGGGNQMDANMVWRGGNGMCFRLYSGIVVCFTK